MDVRYAATGALERLNPEWMKTVEAKRKVPELISALKDEDWGVRQGAGAALGQITEEHWMWQMWWWKIKARFFK